MVKHSRSRVQHSVISPEIGVADLRPRYCVCGCGREAGRSFCRGHDQRFRGVLRRANGTGRSLVVVQSDGRPTRMTPTEVAHVLGGAWLEVVGQ